MKAVLLIGVLVTIFYAVIAQKKIVCYYGSWAVYRPGNGKVTPDDLDPSVCTHMIYSFVGLNNNGDIKVLDSYNDLPDNFGKDGFGHFNKLKKRNPNMKTLIAIGGWNEASTHFSEVTNNPSKRATFVNNAAEFTLKHGFDGFDLDWEYPSQRDGARPSDVQAFVDLVREMKQRFRRDGLLLTAAVGAGETLAKKSYNIGEIAKHLDFINLMTYDFHGTWEKFTDHNAPLYSNSGNLHVDASVKYWLAQGTPKDKLIMGIPLYGHSYVLGNPGSINPGSPSTGAGPAGPYTRQAGMIGYNEICESVSNGWTRHWDDQKKVPYAVKGNAWYSYDDEESIRIKVEYINSMGLGGAMVWSLETDDVKGACGGKFPLMNTIKNTLKGGSGGSPAPVRPPRLVTPGPPRPPPPPPPKPQGEICTQHGFVRSRENCSVFYQCSDNGDGTFKAHKFQCGAGLYFDTKMQVCNWAAYVVC